MKVLGLEPRTYGLKALRHWDMPRAVTACCATTYVRLTKGVNAGDYTRNYTRRPFFLRISAWRDHT